MQHNGIWIYNHVRGIYLQFSAEDNRNLKFIGYIGVAISLVALTLTVLIYIFFR